MIRALIISLCLLASCSKPEEKPIPAAAATARDTNAVSDSTLLKKYEAGQCQAITKKGTRCKRRAQAGSEYCWQHQKG